jgi:hypothetical protein
MTMSSQNEKNHPPLDLSGWSWLPTFFMVVGGFLALVGFGLSYRGTHNLCEFGISWLFGFMFYYSIALGSLFLVMAHHLTSAGWSVGIRRFSEHIASLLFPWLFILFLPVALLGKRIYTWMTQDPATNNLVAAKLPVFTMHGFWVASAIIFGIWWLLTSQLCRWSFKQDETGEAICTRKLRFHSGWGIVVFALTLTFSGVLWMKSLQYVWFSAMHGVYFFSTCAWTGLATTYVIAATLYRQGSIAKVMQNHYFYFIGVLMLGFTLFSSYTEFAQYFVVWNANVPEETFWYLIRENGTWFALSMILILGKCFIPFFVLLPVHVKTNFRVIIPTCILIWVMQALDLGFNIFPALYPQGYHVKWLWLPIGILMLMGGFLAKVFLKKFNAHSPYPQRDPHVLEAMGVSQNVVRDLVAANSGGAK